MCHTVVHLCYSECLLCVHDCVCLITIHNSSCGKVMFSQACVKNSVYMGGGTCMAGGCIAGGECMVRGVHGRRWPL